MDASNLLYKQPVFVMGVMFVSFLLSSRRVKVTSDNKPDISVVTGRRVFAFHDQNLSSLPVIKNTKDDDLPVGEY